MPLYEYFCSTCGNHFRRLLARSKASSPVCPFCLAKNSQRLFSRFSRLHSDEQLANIMEERYGHLGESTDPQTAQSLMRDLESTLGEEAD